MSSIAPSKYSVAHAIVVTKNGEKDFLLLVEDGIPMIELNQNLQVRQLRSASGSDSVYYLARYLRYLESRGIEFDSAKYDDIYLFIHGLYVAGETSYDNLCRYISVVESAYENLALRGHTFDDSLYRPDIKLALASRGKTKIKGNKDKLTIIGRMKYLFSISAEERMEKDVDYLKWYTPEQADAIASQLRLDYACIFWISIITGFRISSIVSIKLSTTFLKEAKLRPTFSKTGRVHTASIPPFLNEMISNYISGMRREIVEKTGSTSDSLFLTKTHKDAGKTITAAAFRAALITAAKRAKEINPNLSLDNVHTHAGRSTFLANIRSRQIMDQREGRPTFSDSDICALMDWKSMQCLDNYDLRTRVEEISPWVMNIYANSMPDIDTKDLGDDGDDNKWTD
ncbi:site-specific integrase [Ruminococcaceae bacterium OttesenSCG-928-O06]|nr:site-specific integrase [Ruminococcaceae bacterium OttesenSCG-928-O06]